MRRPTLLALATTVALAVIACGDGDGGADPVTRPSASPGTARAEPTATPLLTADPEGELCVRVAEVEQRLDSLRAVELRLPNRVALDIALDKLMVAYVELEDADFGESEERLAGSLKRLGYRLGELELAVEDFRTNSRPRRAVPHVEEDAQGMADELAAFVILSRC